MDWTFDNIKSKVRSLTGRPSTNQLAASDLENYINNYYQDHLPLVVYPSELQEWDTTTTSASTGEYDVGVDVIAIYPPMFLVDSNEYTQLTFMYDVTQFFTRFPERANVDENEPTHVLMFDEQLWCAPIPDDTYTLKYPILKRPTALSTSSDTPLKNHWGEAIAYGAAMAILMDAGDVEEAAKVESMLDYHLRRIRRGTLFKYFTDRRASPNF